ncbi:unnamed protein product [Gadus morhua 'NCC']
MRKIISHQKDKRKTKLCLRNDVRTAGGPATVAASFLRGALWRAGVMPSSERARAPFTSWEEGEAAARAKEGPLVEIYSVLHLAPLNSYFPLNPEGTRTYHIKTEPMAFGHASCVWTLVLGACVALAMGTDCGKECALCVYRLLGQQPPLTSPFQTCSLECEGGVDSRKLRLCRELLLDEENPAPALDEEEDVDPDAPAAPADPQAEAPEHQLVKKYGGFMKRYGGFMARRAPPASVLMQGAPEEAGGPGRAEGRGEDGEQQEQEEEEEENIRLEILKILNAEAEGRAAHGAEAEGRAAHGAEAKRYGGFMRRAGLQADPLEAVLGRALKKRYGGFMRRVGRPEWLVDDSNKSGNGVLKRAWEDGRELQKRYGGFMD